jgi:hypothetical protein
MTQKPPPDGHETWQRYAISYKNHLAATAEFLLVDGVKRIDLLRYALRNQDRTAAVSILSNLNVPEIQ